MSYTVPYLNKCRVSLPEVGIETALLRMGQIEIFHKFNSSAPYHTIRGQILQLGKKTKLLWQTKYRPTGFV